MSENRNDHSAQPGDERIPVFLITGFLGSGKTTLLNKAVRHPALANSLVIINEIGEIGIDHLLVSTPSDNLLLLSNGCLCCVLQGDLVSTFAAIHEKRRDGQCPAFDQVIVETTGLADPVPIIQTLVTDRVIADHFRLAGVITLVDAVHGELQLARHRESVKQAVVADSLLISKTDLAPRADVDSLRARLARINPTASIRDAPRDMAEPRLVFPRQTAVTANDVENWLRGSTFREQSGGSAEASTRPGDNAHTRGAHASDVNVFTIYHEAPIGEEALHLWLHMLAGFRGHDVLRVKGILNVQGSPLVVHVVQTIIDEPVRLERWPSDDRRSRLVFITRKITKRDVEGMLESLSLWAPKRTLESRASIDPTAYANFVRLATSVRR
jgi:G3E family GTPase